MNKKLLLTITTLSTVALTIGVVVALSGKGFGSSLKEVEAEPLQHTVEFKKQHLVDPNPSYDTSDYCYYLDFHMDDAITDAKGNKYDMDSYYCYLMSDESASIFSDPDSIIKLTSAGFEDFHFEIAITNRATLDLDKSVINCHMDGDYFNEKFIYGTSISGGRDLYAAGHTFYPDWGKTITIDSIKLVFSC